MIANVISQNPPPKPAPSFMSPLIHLVQTSIPKEFQLPDDVRGFFKDGSWALFFNHRLTLLFLVATGPNGTYVDSSELKQPRLK